MGNIISKDVFNHLLDHMLDIHRKKMGIVSAYTLDYDSYTGKLDFLNLYIKGIETYLESALAESEATDLPFVILGSNVHLRCIGTDECIHTKIVLPSEQNSSGEQWVDPHVCFSDWGHALLLKRAGEHIKIGNPPSEYIIERITMNTRTKESVEKNINQK